MTSNSNNKNISPKSLITKDGDLMRFLKMTSLSIY